MNDTTRRQIKADIEALLKQGPGAEQFFASLAKLRCVSVEEVQEVAAECGPARNVTAAQVAQERVIAERQSRLSGSAAAREYDQLED